MFTAYVDDSTFFLEDRYSVKNIINFFQTFSQFSGLKPNISECEIASIGLLKGAIEIICWLKLVNLTVDTIKILGVHFSDNKEPQIQRNFFITIRNIQKILYLWNSRNFSLKGRIFIFNILAISKIVYLSLLTDVPNAIINEIQSIQKNFLWYSSQPKINNKTLSNSFDDGGIKNVYVKIKIINQQCS